MPQIINTNIASLNAQRNLDRSQSANEIALQRLSSGLRINSAKDDAAGLAISTRFESQVRGLNVAIRNAGDGISLAQTAEGALGSMQDSLQRIRELAVQSANATNSDSDRLALNSEAAQLIAEITRVAEETNFNGRKLLDGSFNGTFQIGANAGENLDFSVAKVTADNLGAGVESGISALGTDQAFSNGDLVINGVGIRSSSATDDTASTAGADRSAISKAAAINEATDDTGVTAEINENVASGTGMVASATDGSVTLNGVRIDIATGGVDTAADRASVIEAVNAKSSQTGVTAVDTGDDATGINLIASDGRNIELTYNKFDTNGDTYANGVTAAATGLAAGGDGATSGAVASSAVVRGLDTVILAAFTETLGGSFSLQVDNEEAITVTITNSTLVAATMDSLVTHIQNSIDSALSSNGYDVSVTVSNNNGVLQLQSDTTGPESKLVLSAFTTVGGTYALTVRDLFGLNAAFTDAASMYFEDVGATGEENAQATFTGAFGLVDNGGGAANGSTNITTGDATFSIEVDGAVAVTVTVVAEAQDIDTTSSTTLATSLTAYTNKIEAAINSALSAAGQAGAVDVTYDDGYRLVITSREEGTDSQIRITGANTVAENVGVYSHTMTAITVDDGDQGAAGVNNASSVYEGSLTLRSLTGEEINITSGSGSLESTGLTDGSFQAGQAYAATSTREVSGGLATSGQVVGERTSTGGLDDSIIVGAGLSSNGVGFNIEVDGGNAVSVAFTATVGELDSLDDYLTALETDINAQLTADSQNVSVSVSVNDDNQLVIASNGVGADSSVKITTVVTTGDNIEEMTVLGLHEYMYGVGSSGAVATQGELTGIGEYATLGANMGTKFTAAYNNFFAAETMRISVDGGKTIDVTIANVSIGNVDAALSYVAGQINDALAADGQSGSVALALNTDGRVTITSDKVGAGSAVEILSSNTTADSFSVNAGMRDYMKAAVAIDGPGTPDPLDSGDLIINGVAIEAALATYDTASYGDAESSNKAASAIAMAQAINNASDQTNVVAVVNENQVIGGTQVAVATTDTPQQGSIWINGVETALLTTNGQNGGADDRAAAIDAINAISGQTGVVAVDDGTGITLSASDGRNISVAIDNKAKAASESSGSFAALTGAAIGLNVTESDIAAGASFDAVAETHYASITLSAAGAIEVEAGQNGTSALEGLGLRAGTYGAKEAGIHVSDIDISTIAGAEAAIKAVDNALDVVAGERAELGAVQNRMESTVSNLAVTSENLAAANSRIRDADFAAESAELSRTQVLQQAGISILAQANQRPQQVLSLLG